MSGQEAPLVPIGDLASSERGAFKIGPFGSSLKKSELVDRGVVVLGIENVLANHMDWIGRRFISPTKYEELADYAVQPGDILVTTMGTIGRAAVVPERPVAAIIDSHLFRMRVDVRRILPKYLAYALNSEDLTRQLAQKSRGSIMDGLNTTILKECTLRVPPLWQQEAALSRLDLASGLLRTRRYALKMSEGILGAAFEELGVAKSRTLPLEKCCTSITDGTHQTPKFCRSGVPFIFVKNVRNGTIDFATDSYISAEDFAVLSRHCPVESGDILYTIVGATYGQAAVVGRFVNFSFQRHLAHLKPDRNVVDPEYLAAVMQLPVVKWQADNLARGAAQPTVNLKELRTFRVPVPSKETQTRLATVVRALRRQRATLLEAGRQSEHLFETLLHQAFWEEGVTSSRLGG